MPSPQRKGGQHDRHPHPQRQSVLGVPHHRAHGKGEEAMKFTSKGNKGIEIEYEDSDTIEEMRVIEQGVATLRNILILIKAGK